MSQSGDGNFAVDDKLDAFTLYHIVQQKAGKESSFNGGPALPALGHAVAGGIASALAKAVVYPIDTVTTRLQVQKQLKGDKEAPSAASGANLEYAGPLDAAVKIYNNEGGLPAFYTGLSSDVVKTIVDSFLFFLAYGAAHEHMLKRQGGKQLTVMKELSVGVVAGALSKAVTTPIGNIVTRQQTAALVAARDPTSAHDGPSVRAIARRIRSEKGFAGFWSGYSAQLVLTLNPAITFAVDNLLRKLIPRSQRDSPSSRVVFLVAAMSKVIATAITYPVMLAKARAQATTGKDYARPEDHIYNADQKKTRLQKALRRILRLFEGQLALYQSLRRIHRTEGVAGLYSGLQGELVKGFLQHGLTMTIKDNVMSGVIQLYYFLLKLTKRWPEELKHLSHEAGEMAKDVVHRGENVGATVVEGAKDLSKKVVSEDISQSAGTIAKDVQQRAENIGTTIKEGVKNVDVSQDAGSVAKDVKERAGNVAETVTESAKSLGKKAVGEEN
ncbi:unnamed protein product [Zymoseptoria tritici ST99CH_1A5]|uniref:Mitochondrial carrier protein n=3 Tax=Zymoseptoria tritici TaxID=1047171 RepID=A0A1X7RN67_ZYMT9|nr:unnamed protein product [Zymoseptoria tritici ST99CH_3D7]SMR48690.1 unnamed protein product [Zymoseptoria tritici ST99CH_1E4]SMR49875.1 unnamed protein product [Zymoseptoria tritici ST99CH_3D1]SMY22571.1 unnamed protein product [Zymoseptoria tritici ST99CH_1A5]